jgi:hypothetical protein
MLAPLIQLKQINTTFLDTATKTVVHAFINIKLICIDNCLSKHNDVETYGEMEVELHNSCKI